MRFLPSAAIAIITIASILDSNVVIAKKSRNSRSAEAPTRRSSPSSRPPSGGRQAPVSHRRPVPDDDEEEEYGGRPPSSRRQRVYEESDKEDILPTGGLFDEDVSEEEEEEEIIPPPRKSRKGSSVPGKRPPPKRQSAPPPSRKRPPPRRYEDEDEEEDEEYFEEDYGRPTRPQRPVGPGRRSGVPPPSRRGPPPRGPPGGRVVPYAKPPATGGALASLSKGFEAVKSYMPDPSTVKQAAVSGISAARQTTSSLSSNIYREVKGLTSSELEQVMLKATKPDDTAVKGKHVERLVGVTYQISSRYDIYDAVLRKLWAKMAEKDWRTKMKALYILHRFAADGAPEHAPALKARLRELRRTRDPKRKEKYFNSKQLLAGDNNPGNAAFFAFMSRYAHYVLLRAQCFGGLFEEISTMPKPDKKSKAPPKPITMTALRLEHLDASAMLLKAGVACQLKDGEECENTALSAERVASDMIGLTTAVAIALNRALKDDDLNGADPALIKKWCKFYSESLLPQTRAMVKNTSPKLDAYGLFLPSRMGANVPPDLLEKGLHLEEEIEPAEPVSVSEDAAASDDIAPTEEKRKPVPSPRRKPLAEVPEEEPEEEEVGEAEYDDEYEYEEEEYYDEE